MSWVVKLSSSRKVPYYLNLETHESRWEPPPALTLEQLLALPGASDLLDQYGNPKEAPGEPGQIRASHFLVKHRDSRRPSSWKSENITRTKAEAINILKGYAAQIQASSNPAKEFGVLSYSHSDCSSHSKHGDLGWFGMGQMQRPFEEATTALSVGQISGVVETDSGVHLILRTG